MERTIDWASRLDLAAHAEGGYFRRIYTDHRSQGRGDDARPWATSIHYLLTRDAPVGRLHRNRSTILHYLQHGGPVEYVLLPAPGVCRRIVLGYGDGQDLFLAVDGGCWKGSRLTGDATHALISEVVVPGFDYADHEFMTADELGRSHAAFADGLQDLVR